ncbi:uncharacterized protein CEXT_335051 [Caerostris extrusa]|uniref:Peptidase S1 domain-containing protein n=1 Tax=Caerostris extrusa TaxID=172846 RepID=A0AAV4N895_CAEEX|nr:uncharacterized protein CEXT_335051 [Caerostris extrusa]
MTVERQTKPNHPFKGRWLVIPDCGRESTDRAPGSLAYRIVSTEFVRPLHRFPWMVQIRVAGEQWGSGSIITPSYVLTAAHVAKQIQVAASYSEDNEISLKDASVGIATQSKNKEFVSFRIHQIKLHPGFKSAGEHPIFDIALLKLKDVLIFSERLRPICLTRNLDLEKSSVNALIIGWGKMTKGGNSTSRLKQAVVPIVPNKMCRELHQENKKNR